MASASAVNIDKPSLGNNIETIFALLESSEKHVVEDIRRLILDNLSSARESWLIHTFVDYYYVTHSARIEDILAEVKEPQDKPLLEKLQDGLKNRDQQLPALQLLLHIVYKQPPWTHKIVQSSVLNTLLKCLKNAIDIPVLMTALMIITMLLPVVPVTISRYLPDIFDIFLRLSTFSIRKPANTPDIFLVHLQVGLYSLLHRLYGMYPSSFLSFLHQQYKKKDNTQVFEEVIMPMLERVRLHPGLVAWSREHETSAARWRSMETQDVVVECAKMSLDLLEGSWEQLKCPIFAHSHQVAREILHSQENHQHTASGGADIPTAPPFFYQGLTDQLSIPNQDMYLKYSPSVLIGLSTPPLSQGNTPTHSFLDVSTSSLSQSLLGTQSNTPQLTPISTTPRETPTLVEDSERATSRNSSRSLLQKSDPKRQSMGSTSSRCPPNLPDLRITPGSQPSSIPPSPLKAEFTSEPPKGTFKSQPVKRAIRELRFDRIPEVNSDQSLSEKSPEIQVTCAYNSDNVTDGIGSCDSATEAVTLESLDHVMQVLSDNTTDGEIDDPEVTEINKENETTKSESSGSYDSGPATSLFLTAESVKQFMTKVNRIRFNSLTNSEQRCLSDKRNSIKRSSSCPLFVPENGVIEECETFSRCASTSFQSQTESTTDVDTFSPVDEKSPDPIKPNVQTMSEVPKKDPAISKDETVAPSQTLPPQNGNTYNIMNVFQKLVMPANWSVCRNCRSQLLVQEKSESQSGQKGDIQMFSTLSPVELLDRHLKMGSELHAKELTKIPLTSKESVHWTHFGGTPPVDEVNILRGQLLLLHNQLQYERHKRDLHAKRNRRLLRKIANATALEEQNKAMTEQLKLLEGKINNMQVSIRLLQDENQDLRQAKDSNQYEKLVQFKLTLQKNRDLEMANTELKSLLITQREDHDKLKKMVEATEHRLFNKEKQLEMMQVAVSKTDKLKEYIFQQQKEILLLGELQQKYVEKIAVLRRQQSCWPEQNKVSLSLNSEIKGLKTKLERKTVLLEASHQKLTDCEEMLKDKEIALKDMKARLEAVKTTHEDELKASEAKYQMTVRMNQEYEARVLDLYTQLDQLKLKLSLQRQGKASISCREKLLAPAADVTCSQSVPPGESATSSPSVEHHKSSLMQGACADTSLPTEMSQKYDSPKLTAVSASKQKGKGLDDAHDSLPPSSEEASDFVYVAKGKSSSDSGDSRSVSSRSNVPLDNRLGGKSTK